MLGIALPVLLAGCPEPTPPLAPATTMGTLVVAIRDGGARYFQSPGGAEAGVEHDLAALFAEDIGTRPRFVVVKTPAAVLDLLRRKRVHLAAAGLPADPDWAADATFGPGYLPVQARVAYNAERFKPGSLADLKGREVWATAGSPAARALTALSARVRGLTVGEAPGDSEEDLIARLAGGEVEAVAADSSTLSLARRFHPNVDEAFPLGPPVELAWAFPRGADEFLTRRAGEFFQRVRGDGTLARIVDRYLGHARRLDSDDIQRFLSLRATTLKRYRALFQKAEEETGVDWRMLAALAYQESQWNPLATSPTNVRGMMMLTEDTADRMKVSDRLDPAQSILAGARYYAQLRDQLPERIREPDRSYMALAAYNLGIGHLEDGRILAQRQKLDPDAWLDLKKALPQLARPEVAETVKHGQARGGEAVIMTENVRSLYDILARFEPAHSPALPGVAPQALMRSTPPMYGRSTAGTDTLPSGFW